MPSGYYARHTAAAYGGGSHITLGKSGSAVKNDGGTIFTATTINTDLAPGTPGGFNRINAWTASYIGIRSGFSEAPPYNGSHAGGVTIGTSAAGATFAFMTAGRYIMLGFTNFIAGISNTLLNSPANFGQHPWRNAFGTYIRTTLYITQVANGGTYGGWYFGTGVPVNRGHSYDQLNAELNPGSYAIPGQLVYMSTGKTATTVNYSAKND